MSRRHHGQIGGGQEIIFNAPLDEVNGAMDLISGVNGTVTSGTFDSTTHSVSGSAVRYNGIVKWDLNGQAFPTKVQAAYDDGKTIYSQWEMYCQTTSHYATPFTIGTYASTVNTTRFLTSEGQTVDPRPSSSANINYISPNTWVQITFKVDMSNLNGTSIVHIMTSERPQFVLYSPAWQTNCTANIIRYVNIFGKCWGGGGTWTGKMRNVLIWIE